MRKIMFDKDSTDEDKKKVLDSVTKDMMCPECFDAVKTGLIIPYISAMGIFMDFTTDEEDERVHLIVRAIPSDPATAVEIGGQFVTTMCAYRKLCKKQHEERKKEAVESMAKPFMSVVPDDDKETLN